MLNILADDTALNGSRPQHAALTGWMRSQRKKLDLTQTELARTVFVSLSAIQKVEGCKRRPSKDLIQRLLAALEIPEAEQASFVRLARTSAPADTDEPAEPLVHLHEPRIGPGTGVEPITPPVIRLLGRSAELRDVMQRLQRDDVRVISITGGGGVGKTALAQAAAQQWLAETTRPAVFVSLVGLPRATTTDAANAAVSGAIFQAFGLNVDPERLAAPQVVALCNQQQRLLLILDNFEHVLAARDLLAQIVLHAQNTKIIITSRERLHMRSEFLIPLRGLPQHGADSAQSDAAQLFLEHARRLVPDIHFDEAAHGNIAGICKLVDGYPLGILLAAEQTPHLTPAEIRTGIQHNLDTLASLDTDVPASKRSMRAIFEWSWGLLSPHEQIALAQCSVFQDGFYPDAADAALLLGAPADAPPPLTRAVLNKLVETSLLRRSPHNAGRLEMHELLRQFAAQKMTGLFPEQRAALHQRYTQYFLGLLVLDESEQLSIPPPQLRLDLANLRAAWSFAIAQRNYPAIDYNATGLLLLCVEFNLLSEGVRIFDEAAQGLNTQRRLAGASAKEHSDVHQVMIGLAYAHKALCELLLYRLDAAITSAHLALADGEKFFVLPLYIHSVLALAHVYKGDTAAAAASLSAAAPQLAISIAPLAMMRRSRVVLALYEHAQGAVQLYTANAEAALQHFEKAQANFDAMPRMNGVWQNLLLLAAANLTLHNPTRAAYWLDRAAADIQTCGRGEQPALYVQRGELALYLKNNAEALRHAQTAVRLLAEDATLPFELAKAKALEARCLHKLAGG